jgi:hypothetical protein
MMIPDLPRKFCAGAFENQTPHTYPDIFEEQKTTGPPRLAIGASKDQIQLISRLVEGMPEPYGVLYLLVTSRCDQPLGRYQSEEVSRIDLMGFLRQFRDYLHTMDDTIYGFAQWAKTINSSTKITISYTPTDHSRDTSECWRAWHSTRLRFQSQLRTVTITILNLTKLRRTF